MEAVAAAAGVSRALVSLVVRNQPKVSEERRARVLEAARQLGYRPNAMARNLASRRTSTVGVLLNDFHNPFFAEIVDGIERAASDRGYRVLFNTGDRHPRGEQSALEGWLELRVDGAILVGPCLDTARIVAASRILPLVVVSRPLRGKAVDTIATDDRRGASIVVEHLAGLGHRQIVHVDGGRAAGAAMRRAGYVQAMRRLGLADHIQIIGGEFTDLAGARAIDLLLKEGDLPSAIFAANDFMAAGMLDRLQERDVRVPEDISLVGYDNTSLAALHYVSLTTIDQPRFEMGRLAIEMLLARIADPGRRPERRLLSPSLVIRRTTAPVRAARPVLQEVRG